MTPFSFHPEAEAEFADAALFYESRIAGLERQFSAEDQRIITLYASIRILALQFACRFEGLWSTDFHTRSSIDAIESQFTFSPLHICGNTRAIGDTVSSAPTVSQHGRAGTCRQLGECLWRRAGYLDSFGSGYASYVDVFDAADERLDNPAYR